MEIRSVAAADARSLRRGLPAHVDDEHPLALHVAGFEDGCAVGIVSGVPVGPEGQKDGTWLQVYGRCGEQGAALVDALAARVPTPVVALWAPEPEPTLAQRGNRWERRLHRYTEADIQVLEGLEAIRKRPGMYVGSCGARGVENLLWEPVSNAIDEHLLGHVTRLEVQLGPEGITVRDDGRGIPPEALEIVFGRLHAGSYRGEPRKHVHVGLHGVGLPVVTALSSVVVATTDRGQRSQQTYVQGRAVTPVVEVGPRRRVRASRCGSCRTRASSSRRRRTWSACVPGWRTSRS